MVGHNLHKVYLESMHIGSLGRIIKRGNIKFIPKPRDPKIITNWRLITLLNVSYKIIAKALDLRIHHLLPLLATPEQIGFIRDRFILNNIFVIWEGMKWARISGQDVLFIKIDFEKAYDRIEWRYILSMLKALGFGPVFIQSISILFKDASAILNLNNSHFDVIGLFRSIRQGCLVARSLYILAAEALGYLLAAQTLQNCIHCIALPHNQGKMVNGHFADGSFLMI